MSDKRQAERTRRSLERPIVGSLPDFPGILAAMHLSSDLAQPLRALADFLLVSAWEEITITRADREMIATAVSAANDCFYCMDSHGAFCRALLLQDGSEARAVDQMIADIKAGDRTWLPTKIQALLSIALSIQSRALDLTSGQIELAKNVGASDRDIQLTVLIAAAFSMYNRMVDGFRAATPAETSAFTARSYQIAAFGYQDRRLVAIPAAP
ncbi:carboxymuconolactone decarboxylase family protein (plasmid) [Rhizobium leguminosarum]